MKPKIKIKVTAFFKKHKFKFFKKGEYLIRAGQTPRGVFCLMDGIVRSSSLLKNDTEIVINLFKPVSFFPTNWVVNNRIELYSYQALTDIEVCIAPKKEFQRFLKNNPDVMFDLLRRIYRGLEGYQLRVESLLSNNDYYKVLIQILISLRRFGELNEDNAYRFKLKKEDIVSLTGLSKEIVEKEIYKLRERRLLNYANDYFIVPDISFLESEAFLM